MSAIDSEFVNPTNIVIKSEIIKDDLSYNETNFPLDPSACSTNAKCGEIFTSNYVDFLLICAYCGDNYSSIIDFGEHLRCKHTAFCETILKTEADTKIEEVTTEENDFVDTEEERELVEKPEKRSKPKFVCKCCNKLYRYKLSFQRHKCPASAAKRKEAASDDQRLATADSEPEPHLSATNEASDRENSDDENLLEPAENEPREEADLDQTIRNPELFCEICYRQFKYKNVFRKHGMQHEVAPMALQNDPTYRKCIYCGMTFTNNGEWFRHESDHPKTGPLRCSQCSKKFKTEYELELHAKSHVDQGPVTCEQCGMTFSQAKNLASHINRVHLQLKPFSCELCDRKFVRKVELRVHMRRHTGERPYQCEECGRSFMISTLLNEHLKRHSNVRDVKCPDCPMAFFTKKMLRKHMVKHSTERPYVCPTCGNNFSRKKALLAHKKIHMDVKQYVCNLCGKAFAQHAGLYMHKKTHMNAVDS